MGEKDFKEKHRAIDRTEPKGDVMQVDRKRKRSVTAKPATKLQMNNEAILRLYEDTLSVIEKGINAGKACGPVGLLSLLMYADFLHGGAYAAPINKRPFYMKEPIGSPYFAGDLQNTDASSGFVGWLLNVLGVTNAGPLNQQILIDANVPHVFPKLLSDEAYAAFTVFFAHLSSQEVMQKAGTNLTTLVEAAGKAEQVGRSTGRDLQALFKLLPK
jgi:hypothetical protein